MVNGLDVVAVGVEHEGGVIAGVIGAQAGGAVVGAAGGEAGMIKGLDLGVVGGLEREVDAAGRGALGVAAARLLGMDTNRSSAQKWPSPPPSSERPRAASTAA